MQKDDRDYIAPNLIGRIKLTSAEKECIRKEEQKPPTKPYILELVCLIILFTALGFLDSAFRTEFFLYAGGYLIILLTAVISAHYCRHHKYDVHYKAAAYGTVIEKEVIFREEKDHTGSLRRKAHDYLAVRLENGKYVRYVECRPETFGNLNLYDEVLVICYGQEDVKGYRIVNYGVF